MQYWCKITHQVATRLQITVQLLRSI